MIKITQIDDQFSIYKENTVVLLGAGQGTKQLLDLMRYHKIDIHYICDNNQNNWGKLLEGIPVISPPKLQQMAQSQIQSNLLTGRRVVVQVAVNNAATIMEEQLKSIGVEAVISFDEAFGVFHFIKKLALIRASNYYKQDTLNINIFNDKVQRNIVRRDAMSINNSNILITCLPPKTGNFTLEHTFNKHNIPHTVTAHTPLAIDKDYIFNFVEKIKIISAIREPIAQNISNVYQKIGDFSKYDYKWLASLAEEENLLSSGGDANTFFKIWDKNYGKTPYNLNNLPYSIFSIECFFDSFKENIIDLSAYPFDHEKGYTIIKEGNIEVFVYQLERMNDIVKEMSDWIGQTPFDTWIKANEASSKWVANSYKQAQKEITFSQEYFDRCYNDPWVQHFYSKEDIEKFKDKWRPHIK